MNKTNSSPTGKYEVCHFHMCNAMTADHEIFSDGFFESENEAIRFAEKSVIASLTDHHEPGLSKGQWLQRWLTNGDDYFITNSDWRAAECRDQYMGKKLDLRERSDLYVHPQKYYDPSPDLIKDRELPRFEVIGYDMFHAMTDQHSSWSVGYFDSEEEAIRRATGKVRSSIQNCYQPGMTVQQLESEWSSFGNNYCVVGSNWTAAEVRRDIFEDVVENQ